MAERLTKVDTNTLEVEDTVIVNITRDSILADIDHHTEKIAEYEALLIIANNRLAVLDA